MHAIIPRVAAGIVPQMMPTTVADSRVVGARGSGSVPDVPVKFRRRLTVGWQSEIALQLHVKDAAQVNLAQLAVFDKLFRFDIVRCATVLRPNLDHSLVLPRSFYDLLAFPWVVTWWLFDVDIFAGLATKDSQRCMPVVGRRDDHRIDRFLVK